MKKVTEFLLQHRRPLLFLLVGIAHLLLLLYFRISVKTMDAVPEDAALVMKLVDVEEYLPPPPPPEIPEDKIEVSEQPEASEEIVEVEQEVIESDQGIPTDQLFPQEPDYLPQHKISRIPEVPSQTILDRIIYPPIALRQELEAVVYLELYIDQLGNIRRVEVLRDPGNGFAEAALAALEGLKCVPAEANGEAVAVRFRYPIRFSLN